MSFQLALLTATIVNVVQGALGGKQAKMVTAKDFLPVWDSEQRQAEADAKAEQSLEEMKKALLGIATTSKNKEQASPQPVKMKRRQANAAAPVQELAVVKREKR